MWFGVCYWLCFGSMLSRNECLGVFYEIEKFLKMISTQKLMFDAV